ncbi:MAG: hypothetical protein ABSF29_06180 [Tepidisphaeraceae bacterium]
MNSAVGRRRRGSARPVTVCLLVVFLVATAAGRGWVLDDRFRTEAPTSTVNGLGGASLSSMPSFATALLLGGLRGPLVMTLWISSESQKQRNDLQDIDTKIEWIRLLQPEFDAVHLFQIWNKAYNISVKMTSLANKYSTIIDAIDYGQKVDLERPDDVNILSSIAQVYSDKLGISQENAYYRARVRRETQTLIRVSFPASLVDPFRAAATALGWNPEVAPLGLNAKTQVYSVLLEKQVAELLAQELGPTVEMRPQSPQQAAATNVSWRRLRLPPMLDVNGYILPELLAPRFPRPADLPADQHWYDGSQLQFLAQYQPFPYGLSTYALAFNDYKRCQYLEELWKERMLQSNDQVIDSRPAVMLKLWGQDEWERGRRAEIRAVGGSSNRFSDPLDLEIPGGLLPLDLPIKDSPAMGLAIYSYDTAARLFADAREEFYRHIRNDPGNASNYFAHIDDTISMERLMLADRDYLEAKTATGERRDLLLRSAANEYISAQQRFALTMLKYFMADSVIAKEYPIDPATGKRRTRLTIEQAPPTQWVPTLLASVEETNRINSDPDTGRIIYGDQYQDERGEYMKYVQHCQSRLELLQAALFPQTAPSTAPSGQ